MIADTVDNDVEPLFDYVFGEYPVEAIRGFCKLIKGDVIFEKEGFDKMMVDSPPVNALC